MLAGVKGLAAVKVNSLVDAFTKPFLVGGLKRKRAYGETNLASAAGPNGAGEPLSSATNGLQANEGHRALEERRAEAQAGEHPPVSPGRVGSPDWPSDNDDGAEPASEEDTEEASRPPIPPHVPDPDRSPGLSPEARPSADLLDGGEVWRDPLDEDEDDDAEDLERSGGRPGPGDDAASGKRPRLQE